MAQAVYDADWPAAATVLEVGCGIGVVGLAAAAAGWPVTVSDNRPESRRPGNAQRPPEWSAH